MTMSEEPSGERARGTFPARDPLFALEGAVFVILVVVMFTLFTRVLITRAAPSPPVVVLSGGAPVSADGARHLRAVALDPVRERMVDAQVALVKEDGALSGVRDGAASSSVQVFVVSADDAQADRLNVVVDSTARMTLSLRTLPTPMVRVRGVPWSSEVQGARDVPIYPLRTRASSFVDTQALVVEGAHITRELLSANPGRIVDARRRLLPIERSEVDVHLPVIVPGGDVRVSLRAPEGAPVFIDVLVVDKDAVAALARAEPAFEVPARVKELVDMQGRGKDAPVELFLSLGASVPSGSLLLVVVKSAPYPRSRGLSFTALVDDDDARATELLLAIVHALVPEDPLAALVRREPSLIDENVRRALLARLVFEADGLPAVGEGARAQMTDATRAHDAAVEHARLYFRVVAAMVFTWVLLIALTALFRARLWRGRRAPDDGPLDGPDDDVLPRDRTAIMAALAVVGVGAILFGLDAVTRLDT